MNKINLVRTDTSVPFETYIKYLYMISPERSEKISRIKFNSHKITSFFTELEIRKEVSAYTGMNFSDIKFGYNQYGKPYILNSPECFFSVSHSGEFIAFTLSEKPVGIDIEYATKSRMRVAERFFTRNEYEFIITSENPELEFYKIWTKKESYIKMLGTGLSKSLKSFDVLSDELSSYFFTDNIDNYVLSLCKENTLSEKSYISLTDSQSLLKSLI